MKKAFTIFELIIAISIIIALSAYGYKQYNHYQDKQYIHQEIKKIDDLLKVGILSATVGYISSTNENCSSNYNFDDINFLKILECTNAQKKYKLVGEQLVFFSHLGECVMNIKNISTYQIDIGLDCTNLDSRYQEYILIKIKLTIAKSILSYIVFDKTDDEKIIDFSLKID